MQKTNRNSPGKAKRLEAQARALELRRMGFGYQEIANQLNCSLSTAHGYVDAAMADAAAQVSGAAERVKTEEISRLDGMMRGLWPDARKGSYGAIDRVLKIMERRAKLLGLDAPYRQKEEQAEDGPQLPIAVTIARKSARRVDAD